jgi:hypothetical protein
VITINMPAIIEAVTAAGHADDIEWSEQIEPPTDPDHFGGEIIFVICNSGMHHRVATGIFHRVMAVLEADEPQSSSTVFGHKGKCGAIDSIWRDRAQLLAEYQAASDKLAMLETLPWIGGITKYHCAKNFGLQVAKPDVHLQRLADTFKTTPQALCEELAHGCGLKVATVDVILWRAAAIGILDTATGRLK